MVRTKASSKVFLFIVGALLVSSCASPRNNTPSINKITTPSISHNNQIVTASPSDGSTPITTSLTLSRLPGLNDPVELVFNAETVFEAPGTVIEITLPEDAELAEGHLTWTGNLLPDHPVTIRATIRFTTLGNKEIKGAALCATENGDVWGEASYIYFHILEEGSFEGYTTPDARISTETGSE
ncbi:MAG: hypothetical protein JXA13_14580 [Anaerolineales bacterium]|nr:hypothetical protein [Anaerolineales bacterium]